MLRNVSWNNEVARYMSYYIIYTSLFCGEINSLHQRVRKRNFPCNDDNVAFMQQVHSKTTGKRSVILIVQLHSTTELLKNG